MKWLDPERWDKWVIAKRVKIAYNIGMKEERNDGSQIYTVAGFGGKQGNAASNLPAAHQLGRGNSDSQQQAESS